MSLIERRAGEGHEEGPRGAGPDARGELQDVLRALVGLVLDEVRLVHDHAVEAEVADPTHMAVEHLVVHDDDVGETVDRLAVAVDHGDRAVRGPEADLTGPVRLDDVRHDHEQRVGVRRLRRQQGLCRLAQARLVGEEEGPVAVGGRGDERRLVRHQLQPLGRAQRGRHRKGHAGRVAAPGAFERAQEWPEQFPSGQAARARHPLRDGGEIGGQEGVGQLARDHRLRNHPPLGRGRRGRRLWPRSLLDGGLDAAGPHHLPRESPRRAGDDGVLGEQRQQPGVPDGGRREDGGDAVQALELLGPGALAAARLRPDAGPLLPQQQGDRLELRAHAWRHAAALGGCLDLTDGAGEHRDQVTAGGHPSLVPRGGTASARLAPASSSHVPLLVPVRPRSRRRGYRHAARTEPSSSTAGQGAPQASDSQILAHRRRRPREAVHGSGAHRRALAVRGGVDGVNAW